MNRPSASSTRRASAAAHPVGKEHGAELAEHEIEAPVGEVERRGIGRLPVEPGIILLPGTGALEHGRVEVGDHVARVSTQDGCNGRAHAGAGAVSSTRRGARRRPGGEVER
ncbi:MAG: hypothetical protein R3C69_06075 [Geminicoccaceae bacterium]